MSDHVGASWNWLPPIIEVSKSPSNQDKQVIDSLLGAYGAVAVAVELPPGWPTLQEQREYWERSDTEAANGMNDWREDEQQYSNYSEEQL